MQSCSQIATSAFHELNFAISSKEVSTKDLKGCDYFHEIMLKQSIYLSAEVVQPSGNIEQISITPDAEKHNIKVAYQPSERGVHQLQINKQGRPIKGSPFQFFVDTKGEGRVTAYGPGLSSGTTNEVAEFTVITKDAGPGKNFYK